MSKQNQLPEDKLHDDALAEFADNLLDGGFSDDEELEFSDDLELRELQKTAFQIQRAFTDQPPDPAMAARVKKSLSAEWKKEHKKRPFWAVWLGSLSSSGKRGQQARALAFAVAMIPLIAAFAIYTDLFDNVGEAIKGTVGNNGYPAVTQESAVDTTLGKNERISLTSDGGEGNGDSIKPVVSENGRFVVFQSSATNLMDAEDGQFYKDIFLFDRHRAELSRISVGLSGEEANGDSQNAAISEEGKYVVFESYANNLTDDDETPNRDIFIYDRTHDLIERVSAATDGGQANGDSSRPVVSDNGRFVAFSSTASNLVADDANGLSDIFIVDRATGDMERISIGMNGDEADGNSYKPTISNDGRWVAFESWASNLTANGTGNQTNIFVYDMNTGVMRLASVAPNGSAGNNHSFAPSMAGNGSALAFYSGANDLVENDTNNANDIFVYDLQEESVERVSLTANGEEADSDSAYPDISADGNYVVYTSFAANIVGEDQYTHQDIFLYDRRDETTQRVSVNTNTTEPDNSSINPSIGANGRLVLFDSAATDLVTGDGNGRVDIFLRDRLPRPELTMTPHIGANGSYFSLLGDGFPEESTVRIVINGQELGTVNSYTNGSFDVALFTPNTDPGSYIVTAVANEDQGVAVFAVDPSTPIVQEMEDSPPTLEVPPGIAAQEIYLPLIKN